MVNEETLSLLFGLQGATLHTLRLNNPVDTRKAPCQIPSEVKTLRVGLCRDAEYMRWLAKVVARNYIALHHLELSCETEAAKICFGKPVADDERVRRGGIHTFVETLSDECKRSNASIALTPLKLIYCDLAIILDDNFRPCLDLSSLTHLVLEDCHGMDLKALEQFESLGCSPQGTHCLSKLTSFTFRKEYANRDYADGLEDFICALPGLRDLCVLMTRSENPRSLKTILRIHGKSLRTLVWDERSGQGSSIQRCPSKFYTKNTIGHLSTISKACPELEELGLAIDWAIFRSSSGIKDKVFSLANIYFASIHLLIPP